MHRDPPPEPLRDIPPPVPALSLLSGCGPLTLAPASIPPLVLWFAPENVLEVSSSALAFATWMATQVPRLAVHASSTKIPQIATLVDSLIVAMAVLIAFVVFIQTTINYRYLLRRHIATGPHPMKTYLVLALAAPLGIFLLAVHVMIGGDPSWARGATMGRTLFYSFLAFFMPLIAGAGIGSILLTFRIFLDGYVFSRPVTTRSLSET